MPKKLMKGSEAIGEAAVQAGCRLFFGYPITPQNEIPEYMSHRLPQVGGTFVQAESEVAASNMLYGAAGSGERVMTSSSSPGISLMMEAVSYLAGSELPVVIVNLSGEIPQHSLKLLADELKAQLLNIEGVETAEISGEYTREFHVSIDPAKLRRYGITFDQAMRAIESGNTKIPTGSFRIPRL